jgi:hypothetical protein
VNALMGEKGRSAPVRDHFFLRLEPARFSLHVPNMLFRSRGAFCLRPSFAKAKFTKSHARSEWSAAAVDRRRVNSAPAPRAAGLVNRRPHGKREDSLS